MIKAAVLATALLAAQIAGAQAPAPASEPQKNYDPAKADEGKRVYTQNCARCHGLNMRVASTAFFDLRKLRADEKPRFLNSVRNGVRAMPAWGDNLKPDEYELIWSYVITTNLKAGAGG